MSMETKNYYLGLDMGTASVGWAVTDENYRLLRGKGKDLWGIREFETAETAEERRGNRIARRRRKRELARIAVLKEYFADELEKVDPYFLIRLQNSKYYAEDKDELLTSVNGIFDDENYKDRDYYKEFPTIFHLRKELIENNKPPYDVRLVYLAILNLFKRRGHFLNSSLDIDRNEFDVSIGEAYSNMLSVLNDSFDEENALDLPELRDENEILEFQEILADSRTSRKMKAEKIAGFLNLNKSKKREHEVINGIVGLQIDCNKLFVLNDQEEKIKAKFSDMSYSDKEAELMEKLGEAKSSIILSIKAVYDAGALAEILRGNKYLSFSRVEDYKRHKADLILLKKLIRKYKDSETFDTMFRKAEKGSYSAYVNSVNSDKYNRERYGEAGPNRRDMEARSREDFYKTVKKIIGDMPSEDTDVSYIKSAIDNDVFMPKQLTGANGIIPNQLHAIELKKILENASAYLPFLNEKDDTGLSVCERIIKLYTFTLPYYVGPTSLSSKTGWAVRKKGEEKGAILPWNIDKKIDIDATSQAFINRMVRRCTFFSDEQVLPKASLKYEMYCVLNEINNLRIDNRRIDNSLKQNLVNDLYKTQGRPSRKKLEKYLYVHGISEKAQITGIDKELNNGLSSYKRFHELFGDELEKDSCREMVEEIIFLSTVYGESKERLKKVLREKYPIDKYPLMTDKAIKRILGFRFKDWGRLSAKLLDMQGCNRSTGEICSLLGAMWDTNFNFQELISNVQFDFKEQLDNIEKEAFHSLSEIDAEYLDRYYFSAPVKRMILQTLGVIDEITKVMGGAPERLFIEMTRGDQEKGDNGRKDSREKALIALYASIKSEISEYGYWADLISREAESGRLKSKKMYLYIKQMGMDMYTGEPIELDDLFDSNKYDIDHIYPQRYVKDNNIENNMVLTSKDANEHIKKDNYPIPEKIRRNPKVMDLWDRLHRLKMINDVKYARLRCKEEFSEYQLADFIARQVVETAQGTKGVADILKLALPETKLVYSKAGNVSDFRNNNSNIEGMNRRIYKSRIVNENHHAHDAYLNIVVGNVYYTKFTDNPANFIHKEYKRNAEKFRYSMRRMYDWKVERNGKVAWIPKQSESEFGTIDTVLETLSRNTPLLSRRSFEKTGIVNKVTLYNKHKASPESYMPAKTSDLKMQDVTKYGGYTSVSICYYFLVEYEKKGKIIRSIEGLPGYMQHIVENRPEELERYCSDILGLSDFIVRYRKIRIQSLMRINGFYVYLSGKTGDRLVLRNAVQMILEPDLYKYVHDLEKEGDFNKDRILSKEMNEKLYDALMQKFTGSIYAKRPNPIGNTLNNDRKKFTELTMDEQATVLLQILRISAIGTGTGDLSVLGEGKKVGLMLIGKRISGNKEVLLYHTSFTALFNKPPVDLLSV